MALFVDAATTKDLIMPNPKGSLNPSFRELRTKIQELNNANFIRIA